MRERTIMLEVPYYHYDPRGIIIGIRPALHPDMKHPDRALRSMHEAMPGWATLALATQEPVRFSKRLVARIVASAPGDVDELPVSSLWRP